MLYFRSVRSEDFEQVMHNLDTAKTERDDKGNVTMSVSGYVGEGRERHFCVVFSRGRESIEIKVPSYKIIRKDGFSPEEVRDLVSYIRDNEEAIRSQAVKINVLSAFING